MSLKSFTTDTNGSGPPMGLISPQGRAKFPWGGLVGVLLAVLCLPVLLTISEGQRGLLAFSVAGTLFFLLRRSPGTGIAVSIGYLALVGGLRRWLLPVFDWSGTDPLLVAAPGAALAFLMTTRRNTSTTRLTRLLLGLMVLMAVEVVNPLQGGLVIGLTGTLFYLGPLLWYFIALRIGTAAVLRRVVRAVIVISVVAALYGLYQTYFGFNPAERIWIKTVGTSYQALNITSTIVRAFSFFTSAQEYAVFMSLGVVMSWVLFLRGNRLALVPIPLLAVALFLETSRTPVVASVISCVVLWAIQGRSRQEWVPRLAVAGVVAVAALTFGLRSIQVSSFGEGTQALVKHQVGGLLNPLDSEKSTANDHAGMVVDGIINGFRIPTGLGLGATTISGQKFGGGDNSAEVDVPNMFISLGFVGGLLYVGVIVVVFSMAFRYWQATRGVVALAILSVLLVLFGNWLNGGAYSTSMLAWFCIGTLDRLRGEMASVPKAARPQPVPVAALSRLPEAV